MGTYITPGATLKETIDEVLADYRVKPGEHAFDEGRCLWFVVHVTGNPARPEGYPIIALALLTPQGDGYKPMDETMGPYFWSCPKRLLELVPDPREGYSTQWRARMARKLAGARDIDLL
jgi:hypothetical protein